MVHFILLGLSGGQIEQVLQRHAIDDLSTEVLVRREVQKGLHAEHFNLLVAVVIHQQQDVQNVLLQQLGMRFGIHRDAFEDLARHFAKTGVLGLKEAVYNFQATVFNKAHLVVAEGGQVAKRDQQEEFLIIIECAIGVDEVHQRFCQIFNPCKFV